MEANKPARMVREQTVDFIAATLIVFVIIDVVDVVVNVEEERKTKRC